MPLGDAVEHAADDDCVRGPALKPIAGEGESIVWLMVHHSLAGRELTEDDHRTMIQTETDIGGVSPSP